MSVQWDCKCNCGRSGSIREGTASGVFILGASPALPERSEIQDRANGNKRNLNPGDSFAFQMPTLIACLSTGKGTWSEVNAVMRSRPWDAVFLIANEFARENFRPPAGVQLVPIDSFKSASQLVEDIKSQLQGRIRDFEVGLNLVSGTGKEHMAVLEAVMQMGLNFRLVTLQEGKAETMGAGE